MYVPCYACVVECRRRLVDEVVIVVVAVVAVVVVAVVVLEVAAVGDEVAPCAGFDFKEWAHSD